MTIQPASTAARRRAILCVCGSSALFTVASALVKALGRDMPSIEVAFFRSAIALLAMLALLARSGRWVHLRTSRPWGHVARTLFGFASMLASYYGYSPLPLALATAIGFAMPIVLCLLAGPMLGETVGRGRLLAALAGLSGVLIMLRPWQVGAVPMLPVLVVLSGVVVWALAMINIRKLGAQGENSTTIVLWFSFGCSALAGLGGLPFWVAPQGWQWALLIGVGLLSAAAQILMTQGYRSAESAFVAPFEYGAILYAALFGLIFWGELPDLASLLGIAILIGSGFAVWRQAGKA